MESLSQDDRLKKIKALTGKGLEAGAGVPNRFAGAIKGVGDKIFDWVRGTTTKQKAQNIADVVGIATEDTVNSLLAFGPDVANFFLSANKTVPGILKDIPGLEDGSIEPLKVDIIDDARRTPTKNF